MATVTKSESAKKPPPGISGGHLVAKRGRSKMKASMFIWTLCGGPYHRNLRTAGLDEGIKIIDVRHEQVGRIARGRLLAPERQDRLRGDDRGTGHDQRHDRHRQRVSRRKPSSF